SGNTPSTDDNTGLHVTINDGVKMVRAYILVPKGSFRVVLALAGGGYSFGFDLPATTLEFTLTRNSDGSGTLAVPNPNIGAPPLTETILFADLADSSRQNVKTLDFGSTPDVAAANSTNWETLGLPVNKDFPVGLN